MNTFIVPPELNAEDIAVALRQLRDSMSILEMQRLSGVDRQVLYRLMGGTSINRTPYELVVKLLIFLVSQNTVADVVKPIISTVEEKPAVSSQLHIVVEEAHELEPPPLLNISVLK